MLERVNRVDALVCRVGCYSFRTLVLSDKLSESDDCQKARDIRYQAENFQVGHITVIVWRTHKHCSCGCYRSTNPRSGCPICGVTQRARLSASHNRFAFCGWSQNENTKPFCRLSIEFAPTKCCACFSVRLTWITACCRVSRMIVHAQIALITKTN